MADKANESFEGGLFALVPLGAVQAREAEGWRLCGGDLRNLGVRGGTHAALMRVPEAAARFEPGLYERKRAS